MILILSSNCVRNATFTDESGQVLYKTSHPFKLGMVGTTKIEKIAPIVDPADMRDRFDVMGEIDWHLFGSSVIRINGKEMQSDDFLPRYGAMGRKQTFTGPDGHPYRWGILFGMVVLSRDDSGTEVSSYHKGSLGIVGPKRKPRLEIGPEVIHMLDLIILTFVYVEKLHKDKERAARNAGGGGGWS